MKQEKKQPQKAYFHLPGLFEAFDFYQEFLPVYKEKRHYFYEWCEIGSIYGAPSDCTWGGGRVGGGTCDAEEVLLLMRTCGISARLTFSNSLLKEEHLSDERCNTLCKQFERGKEPQNGIILHSDLLCDYVENKYPGLYRVSSTTKVLTKFEEFQREVKRKDFQYVVPDFRLNKAWEKLELLPQEQKNKVEFLCNECCYFGCKDRKKCYEVVSRRNLGEECEEFQCKAPGAKDGYRFSKAMKNPGFISREEIQENYLPMGFSQFKIEGRGLGNALLLEFLLYYMTKPEYQLHVREMLYLDAMLDLF